MAVPLMALVGFGNSLISGISGRVARNKRRVLFDRQLKQAKQNLDDAQNMDVPDLQRTDYTSSSGAANDLVDIGRNQSRTGLSSSEISMLTNKALGNRPTIGGGNAPVGSLFRRLSQGQGMLELGSALADARQKGAANIAQGAGILQGIGDSKARENLSVYGVESKRYDAIQSAAGEAYAQAVANQANGLAQDQATNNQMAMMGTMAAGNFLEGYNLEGGFGSGNPLTLGKE